MKKIISLLLSLIMVVSLVACGGGSGTANKSAEAPAETQATENLVFKIGGIGPTTGGAAVYGQAVKNAVELAVDEVNAKGGMNGYQVEVRFEDDEHDTEKSVNAYNVLKDWGMQILIGTVTSNPCIAVASETYIDNMFQITPSGSAVDCTAFPNVFRVCFSDPNQGVASADFIDSHKLATKVGIIYDSSDVYSNGIYEKFLEVSEGKSYQIVAEEPFTQDSKTDFTTQLNKIKSAGADLVFLPFYYNEAALVLQQAHQMDYKPTFFSCDGMDGILTLENFDKSLAEGVMLLTPFSADATDKLTKDFVANYQKKYKEVPNQFAADAYDAVYIVKTAIENANVTPAASRGEICDALKASMVKIKVDGLTGNSMVWTAAGEPNKEPKAVSIVDGVYKLVD